MPRTQEDAPRFMAGRGARRTRRISERGDEGPFLFSHAESSLLAWYVCVAFISRSGQLASGGRAFADAIRAKNGC